MPLRRAKAYLDNLPVDSATVRAARGTHWTELEYLTADLVDLCQAIFAVLVKRFSEGKQNVPIRPVDRPTPDQWDEDDDEGAGRMSIDEALAAMRQMTPNREVVPPVIPGREERHG